MCLLSPLIIIPIEVTPETAETWETHFTLSQLSLWPVVMGKLVSQHTNTHSIVSWEIGRLENWIFEKTFQNPKIDGKLHQTYHFLRCTLCRICLA